MDADSRLWMTKGEILTLIGAGAEHFRTAIQPALSAEHARRSSGRGHPWSFFAPAVVEILVRRADDDTTDADIWTGAPSPALERLRTAKARMAELDLEERSKSSVPLADLLPVLAGVAGPLRKCGEALGRQFGAGAQALLNEALQAYSDALNREIARRVPTTEPATTTTDNTEGTDDDNDDKTTDE